MSKLKYHEREETAYYIVIIHPARGIQYGLHFYARNDIRILQAAEQIIVCRIFLFIRRTR